MLKNHGLKTKLKKTKFTLLPVATELVGRATLRNEGICLYDAAFRDLQCRYVDRPYVQAPLFRGSSWNHVIVKNGRCLRFGHAPDTKANRHSDTCRDEE